MRPRCWRPYWSRARCNGQDRDGPNDVRTGPFDRTIYRLRNQVERLINQLKQFRGIATRYEKRAENYHTMLRIAAIVLWL